MKRFSSVSALMSAGVVSFSVLTASAAFAAPASEGAAKPALVAQAQTEPGVSTVQAADPAPAGGTPAPAPAPSPEPDPAASPTPITPQPAPAAAAGPEAGSTPAISIGTTLGTPTSDTPSASSPEPTAKPKPRRWAGTQIFASTSMSTATVFKGEKQYNNPTVAGSLYLQPRYLLAPGLQLRGLLVYSYEFTDADNTVTKNEPRFSDTTLSLYYSKIPVIPGDIHAKLAASAGLPTSPESRARTLIFNPGATLQLFKEIDNVIGGEIDLIGSVIYNHPIYSDTTGEIRGDYGYQRQCISGPSCANQLSGTFNTSDQFSYALIVVGSWGKWSPAFFYRGTSLWSYHGKDVNNPVNGQAIGTPDGFNPTHIRQSSYFSAWLDYNANSWFTAELGYWMSRSALTGGGTYGNPFFDRYQDQRVYLGFNFNIDNIMKQLEGGPTEGGIVRAKNTNTGGIMHF